uniref:Rpl5 n=1 Tax=Aegilops longissima TaxID=4486 RepID=W5XJG4_AEGLO|nr:rpl5 [Aegilops longissima]
MMFPLHFHY